MSRNLNRSLWSRMFGDNTRTETKSKSRLALEALEDRSVPATVVTNLLDSTNASSPLTGSLRQAITQVPSDGIVSFDPALFPDSAGPQTLVLNGAVGRLQVNTPANLNIQGPGKFTSGPFAGQYKLIIQADLGIQAASVTSGGSGFRVSDQLQQGFDQFTGGARFSVLSINDLSDGVVNGKGAITAVTVIQPGANSGFRTTGAILSPSGSGVNMLTPIGGSTGSGAFLQVGSGSIGVATGLVQQQMSGATGTITMSGLHFGTGKGDALIVNLGSLIVSDTKFDNTDKFGFPKQSSSYISVSNGAGSLNISNSTFTDSGASAIDMISSGTLTVDGSVFNNNDESGIEYRGGNTVAISNTTIQNNGDSLFLGNGGVFINGSAGVTVTNSLFTGNQVNSIYDASIGGSALALNNVTTATVTNCTFDGNKSVDAGFRLSGEPDTFSFNTGGAAILALQTNNLAVSSSLFRNNQVLNIEQENSGGGAIYDFNGKLTITNCGFENNSISITGYPVNSPSPDTTDYQLNPELQPSARYSGGGAVYTGGSTTIQGTYFSDNTVLNQVDFWQHAIDETATASKPMYSGGGALYLTSNGQATVNNLYNLTFTGNSAIQTGAVSDTRLSGRGSAYVPLGASPTALLLGNYGGGFNTSALTINANNQSFSVASQSGFGGNYTAAAPVNLAAMPSGATGAVAQGDFNGDGNPDFVVANPLVNSISLYLGTNTGSFQLASSHNVGTTPGANPIALTTGDFNNDGKVDVAVANSGETSITVLFGTGFGAFGTVTNLTPTGSPVAVAAGDFNNDGFVDLTAITSTGTLNQFNWDSVTSSFKAAKATTFTSTPASLVLGDVNADGFLDAAVADSGAALVHIYFGQANSTFINNPLTDDYNTGAGSDPRVARLANLNPTVDAFLDLIVPLHGYNQVAIYSNLGAGIFGSPIAYDVQVGPVDAQAGKLSFFGNNVDLVVASDTASSLSILYGTPAGTFRVTQAPTGRGLNGGAMIIADGRAVGAPNNVNFNAFNGSSTTNIINVTIAGNSLVNPFATSVNSNFSTAIAQGSGLDQWGNTTDTGGIFIDTNTGSSTITTNTMLTGNTGLDYLSSSGFFSGAPSTVISNTGRRYFADGYGTFQSKASSMYDPSTTYGFNNNFTNNARSFFPAPGDITQSADTTNLDPKGLQTDVRAPQIGLTSNPLYQGTIKYIPIDRLSPARDAGTSVNVYPAPLPLDTRGANRLINTNVDIGAFEVQYATKTAVTSPILVPADSAHPNAYTLTTYGQSLTLTAKAQWDDNKLPTVGIQGILELVRSSDNTVIAAGALVPVSVTDLTAGGTVTLTINNTLATLLAAGTNTLFFRYSGDMNYAVSQSSPFDVIVAAASTSAVLDTISPNPAGRTQAVTFSGSVTAPLSTQSPVGTIELGYQPLGGAFTPFASNIPVASDGSYSVTTPTGFAYGVYTILAKFDPTDVAKFAVSDTNTQELTIGVVPTVSLFPFANNPVAAGSAVTFSAIVEQTDLAEPLTGSVDFLVSGTNVKLGSVLAVNATPVLNGLMYTFTSTNTAGLTLGSQSIIATYNQDGGSYATTASSTQDLTVTGFNSTISMGVTPATTITYGTKINLSATVASAGSALPFSNGTVTFYEGSTVLGTPVPVTQGSMTASANNLLLTGGTHTLDAGYSGDGVSYNPSTSTPINVVVNPASTTMTLAASSPVKLGMNTTFVSTLSTATFGAGIAGLTGQVVYTIRINGAAPVTIGTVSLVKTGTSTYTATLSYRPPTTGDYSISARYTGDTNFAVAAGTITQTFRVNRVVVQRFYAIAPGTGSTIQLFSTTTNTQMAILRPLGASYTGGFRVNSTGDVTGDGVADLVFTPKTGSFVRIVDGRTLNNIGGFYAFTPSFGLPVNITTGDVNGDFRDDIIVAPGGSGAAPTVKAFNGANLSQVLWSKLAYASTFLGGVTLATADVNNDGRADVITGPMNGGPANVRVFNGINGNLLKSFVVAAYGSSFSGGIFVAANVAANTGAVEIITSVNKGLPQVVVTNYSTLATRASFYAFSSTYQGGCRVTVADTNGDGIKELLVGVGPNAGPLVARYNSNYQRIDQFFAFGPAETLSYNSGLFLG